MGRIGKLDDWLTQKMSQRTGRLVSTPNTRDRKQVKMQASIPLGKPQVLGNLSDTHNKNMADKAIKAVEKLGQK
jgi:hypothetical protein